MTCNACCATYARVFGKNVARFEAWRYRHFGPARATRTLLALIQAAHSAKDAEVLDIGAGIGAAHLELLKAGARCATDVDASSAYLEAARAEAERLGLGSRVTYHYADFTRVADAIAPADIVVLDRTICCYPDMPALLGAAARKARHVLGLVWPRETWWVRAAVRAFNMFERLTSSCPLMVYVHPVAAVDAVADQHGLRCCASRDVGFWHVRVYARGSAQRQHAEVVEGDVHAGSVEKRDRH